MAPRTPGFGHRGVAYDTGTPFSTFQGVLSRNVWSNSLMQEEISLVSGELNGNSVDVYGSDLGRLSEVARLAQSLRNQGADIDLTVGATHTILMPGIFPGDHTHERIASIFFDGDR